MPKDTITFRIAKQPVAAPRNWADIKVNATFDNFNSQANITIDSFEFDWQSQIAKSNGGGEVADHHQER